MLKNDGTIAALPNAFSCADLAKKAMKITMPSVAPEPPMVTKLLLNSPAKAIFAPLWFSTMLERTMGVKNEVTIVAPWIPTIHNACIKK